MDLLDIFYSNLLKEFPRIKKNSNNGNNCKIAKVKCSPFQKREVLQKTFSFLLGGIDVLLISEEQSSLVGEFFWRDPPESRRWGRILLLTSGTSGSPRMVVHSLEELLKSAHATLAFYKVNDRDIWPLSLPLYHIGGFQIALRCLLAGIPLNPIDERFYREGEGLNATLLSLVPVQWIGLSANPKNFDVMRRMKAILIGGAPLSFKHWRQALEKKLPLSPSYGMTEMGSQVAALSPQDFLQGKNSLAILPGRKAKIHKGKIVLSGVGQMLGFFEKGSLVGNTKEIVTQDKGILKKGRLKILGRWDRVIISGGKKIYPQPLEFFLVKHSGILEAALVGLPDEKWGERLHLVYTGQPGLSLEEIRNFLHPHVAPWEIPKGISHCNFLPKKGIHKPDHGQIAQLAQR